MKTTLLIILLLLTIPIVFAAECPFEQVNCTYPGDCGRYIDSDNNQICDSSETLTKINQETEKTTSLSFLEKLQGKYVFLSLTVILFVLYLITYFLSKKQKISIIFHKKFWNFFLLITFLASGLSGILLVLRINYNLVLNFPFNLLYWHVETGISMAIISIFHIFWHWTYFKSYLKFNKT